MIYVPLKVERNYLRVDSLQNMIIEEKHSDVIPFYERLRDYLVTDEVKNLFLIRHTETEDNIENRIGGDSKLTEKGRKQAIALGTFLKIRKFRIYLLAQKSEPSIRLKLSVQCRMLVELFLSRSLMKSTQESAKE